MDYMAISSYGNGMKSSGVVRIIKDLSSQIEGRHVLIAEDILDSGLTLRYLIKNLESRNPASIEVATLLRKDTPNQADIKCKYIGFECPDEFIVGYGLDYAERYRNLSCIGRAEARSNSGITSVGSIEEHKELITYGTNTQSKEAQSQQAPIAQATQSLQYRYAGCVLGRWYFLCRDDDPYHDGNEWHYSDR